MAIHASTFFGFDAIDRIPGVMLFHVAVLGLAFVSIALLNAREPDAMKSLAKSRLWAAAPRWLRLACGVSFVYAIINFALFMTLNEGGGPAREGQKYVLSSHGKTIRPLTESEFHQQQAYVVRGFSGCWLLFGTVLVTFWTGASRDMHGNTNPPPVVPPFIAGTHDPGVGRPRFNGRGVSASLAIGCWVAWIGVSMVALFGTPATALLSLPVLVIASVAYLRRQSLRNSAGESRGMETGVGCLLAFPSAIVGHVLAWRVASTAAVAWHVGWGAALRGDVIVADNVRHLLSDGTVVNGRFWSAVVLLGSFLLWTVTATGMIGLMETAGRYRRT